MPRRGRLSEAQRLNASIPGYMRVQPGRGRRALALPAPAPAARGRGRGRAAAPAPAAARGRGRGRGVALAVPVQGALPLPAAVGGMINLPFQQTPNVGTTAYRRNVAPPEDQLGDNSIDVEAVHEHSLAANGPGQGLRTFLMNSFDTNRMPNVVMRNNELQAALVALPRGYTLAPNPNFSLLGLSVRELYQILEHQGLNPYEYYLSANAIDLHGFRGASGNSYRGYQLSLTTLCLGDISPVTPLGMEDSYFTVRPGNDDTITTMNEYMQYIADVLTDHEGGSNVAAYILLDNIRISRRKPYNANRPLHDQRRTAGFDRLIPWHVERSLFSFPDKSPDAFVFVPGGEENCVVTCVKRGLLAIEEDVAFKYPGTNFDKGARKFLIEVRVNRLFDALKEEWIQQRVNASSMTVQEIGIDRFRKKQSKLFEARNKHGFTPFMFKKFQRKVLDEEGVFVHLVHYVHIVNDDDVDLSRPSLSRQEIEQSAHRGEMLLMQVGVNGKVVKADDHQKGADKNLLAHAVLVHPFPTTLCIQYENNSPSEREWIRSTEPNNPRTVYAKLKKILTDDSIADFVEAEIVKIFTEFRKMCDPKVLTKAEFEKLPTLVEEQNNRYREHFMRLATEYTGDEEDDEEEVPQQQENSSNNNVSRFVGKNGMLVYDLETVENLRGIQEDLVYAPVRKVKPNAYEIHPLDPNLYTVPEAQIPYTVQWGVFRDNSVEPPPDDTYQLKEGSGIRMSSSSSNTFFFDSEPRTPPPPQLTPLEGDEVFVERGDGFLGKCIDDFLENVLRYMKEKNFVKLFAYAHNGCAFDAILVKSFNTKFPMSNILVTPRGILSMTIQLEPGRLIVFRDTKVFFQARLSELCAVFKVPAIYCKTDFPITRVHARNFYDKGVVEASEEYLKNDIYSLAFVVKGINDTLEKIGDGMLIKNVYSPVITQYVTLMSAVKAHQACLFEKTLKIPKPLPVDIPALRKWLNFANVGGRTTAYWKGYASQYTHSIIVGNEISQDVHVRMRIYRQMCEKRSYCQVLDVTSLYPYTMYAYPMPCVATSKLEWIDEHEVYRRVQLLLDSHQGDIGCKCREMWTLCEIHRCGGSHDIQKLGFPIVILGAIQAPEEKYRGFSTEKRRMLMNIVPRKAEGGGRLVYSLQNDAQLKAHHNGKDNGTAVSFPEATAVTLYDLYWMLRCGYFAEVKGAFVFETSYAFRDDTLKLFQKRIEAKRMEQREGLPKSLSTFFKLFYNGRYGINAQQDITSSMIITSEENEVNLRRDRKLKPDEVIVRNANSHQCANGQWILKVEKVEGACEYYANQSPNQIGACVVAAARHHMNLAMFDLCKQEMVGYTDTDSLSIHASALYPPPGAINQSSEAPMGTYKNDHEEGKNEIIWLSFYVTKKVKLHCTLDEEGIIRIYPTFKGYNPPAIDNETGRHRYDFELDRDKVLAISEAFYTGSMKEVEQTEFRRDLQSGITVDKHARFSGKMPSFMGHSAGSILKNCSHPIVKDAFEVLVPLGHVMPPRLKLNEDEVFAPYFKNNTEALEDVQNPQARVDYWEKRVPRADFERFVKVHYEALEKKESDKMDFMTAEDDYQAFDRVFSAAPQVSEADKLWKE